MQTSSKLQALACASQTKLDGVFNELFKLTPDSIKDEMTMSDVELWDSLRHMELIVAIEEKFAIELTFDEISNMQSIGAIRALIAQKTSA